MRSIVPVSNSTFEFPSWSVSGLVKFTARSAEWTGRTVIEEWLFAKASYVNRDKKLVLQGARAFHWHMRATPNGKPYNLLVQFWGRCWKTFPLRFAYIVRQYRHGSSLDGFMERPLYWYMYVHICMYPYACIWTHVGMYVCSTYIETGTAVFEHVSLLVLHCPCDGNVEIYGKNLEIPAISPEYVGECWGNL